MAIVNHQRAPGLTLLFSVPRHPIGIYTLATLFRVGFLWGRGGVQLGKAERPSSPRKSQEDTRASQVPTAE